MRCIINPNKKLANISNNFFTHEIDLSYFDSDKLFSIGEISEICGISSKMLRYYDKTGLVKPAYIDEETGYRFYSRKQIILLTFIKELKCLGLELNEIKSIIDKRDIQTIDSYYDKINEFVEVEIQRLIHIKSRIAQQKEKMQSVFQETTASGGYEISIKEMPEMLVLFMGIEMRLTEENIQLLINEAQKGASMLNLKIMEPYFIMIKDENVKKAADGELVYIEACVNTTDCKDESLEYVKTIPARTYASAKYSGAFNNENMTNGDKILHQWIISHGYKSIGDRMITFLNHIEFALVGKDIKIELLIPIEKS